MNASKLLVFCVIIGGLVVGIDTALGGTNQAALLINIAFWTAIFQGCIALVAVAELAQGKWIQPVKKGLLSVYPMILFSAVLLLCLCPHFDNLYKKMQTSTHIWWHEKWFLLIRDALVLVVSFALAWKFRKDSLEGKGGQSPFAVLYLFSFIAGQSLIAFDLIMPLEYPWFSTLFGGFTFVESLYTGTAFAGIFSYLLYKKAKEAGKESSSAEVKARYDSGILMFALSIMWTYLFFSQFIVIWYGNLPEEVGFFYYRFNNPVFLVYSFALLGMMLVVPFTILAFRKVKLHPKGVLFFSCWILTGIFLNKVYLVYPAANVNLIALVLEFALMAYLMSALLKSNYESLGEAKAA